MYDRNHRVRRWTLYECITKHKDDLLRADAHLTSYTKRNLACVLHADIEVERAIFHSILCHMLYVGDVQSKTEWLTLVSIAVPTDAVMDVVEAMYDDICADEESVGQIIQARRAFEQHHIRLIEEQLFTGRAPVWTRAHAVKILLLQPNASDLMKELGAVVRCITRRSSSSSSIEHALTYIIYTLGHIPERLGSGEEQVFADMMGYTETAAKTQPLLHQMLCVSLSIYTAIWFHMTWPSALLYRTNLGRIHATGYVFPASLCQRLIKQSCSSVPLGGTPYRKQTHTA